MFASTVIGPVPLPSHQVVAGATVPPQESGSRGELGETARPDAAPTRENHRGEAADAAKRVTPGEEPTKPGAETLSEAELRQVEQMKVTDQEVRQHELAHQVAGGAYTGSPSYDYARGPDGKRYVVAGEVPIDYGPVQGDPRATIDKMQQVISAALAPADPSPKYHQVAARARQYLLIAQLEMAQQHSEMNRARGDAQATESSQSAEIQGQAASDAEQGHTTTEAEPVVQLSQYDIIARAANVGAQESLRSLA
ncbi:putative metalloprotease CJM1_0395 family protein [Halomonas sp. LR5S13]|uniref:putative metalloprotease CJM1_0395 family protein n=1 Tax=Halomonas rhizosphaerae TaxID=3043296 RepID=UPI0024A98094|nr:putative metalloprotease CJM1_0395 family protein [Halomonas rhizosphaerae]MDI5922772.1 putative metalloprotease CJM1_0395 family protein [Halomonas rhizosphaerae]